MHGLERRMAALMRYRRILSCTSIMISPSESSRQMPSRVLQSSTRDGSTCVNGDIARRTFGQDLRCSMMLSNPAGISADHGTSCVMSESVS